MRRRVHLLAVASLAGMLALTSAAGASAASTTYATRAQFVYALDVAMGIQPVSPAQPDFGDVPASSPYYAYIEAAYQRGWIQGTGPGIFSPNSYLTRQQMAKIEVTALGDAATAEGLMGTATSFKDDATISSWARGYVVEAVQLGLVKGYPNGTFVPGALVTTVGQTSFIKQFTSVYAGSATSSEPYSIAVTASPTSLAIGQLTTLSAIVKNAAGQVLPNATVTYSVAGGSAIVSGASMIASQAGTYTVTASAGPGVSGTATVSVYGAPVALRLKALNTIVADGEETTTIEAQAIDQYGNVVQNAQGNVALYYLTNQGATKIVTPTSTDVTPMGLATALSDGTTASFANGAADFQIQSGLVAGESDTFYAVEYSGAGAPLATPTAAQLTVTSVLGTATSLSVTAPTYLPASLSTTTNVSVQVLDQAGEPMLFGNVPFTAALTGPATFGNGSAGQQEFFYTGSGSQTTSGATQVPVASVQGETGTVTLTIAATSLPSKSVTMQAVIGGTPSGIVVTPPTTTSFSEAQGATGITFGVAVVDSRGYPTPATPTLDVMVEHNGIVASNIRVDGYTQSSSGVLDPIAASNGKFKLTDTMGGADAGTYTVTVSSEQSGISAASPVSFTETPGPVTHIAVPVSTSVPISDPSMPIQATLEDQFDNTVATSGTVISFANAASNQTPGVTLSATSASTVNGVATVTATVPVYVGNSYAVEVSASGLTTAQTTITVANTVATTLSISFNTVYQGGDSSGTYLHSGNTAQASDTVQISVQSLDPYGHAIPSQDDIEIDFSNTGLVPIFSTGGYLQQIAGTNDWTDRLTATGADLITATAQTAGTTGVTVKDTTVSTTAAGSADFLVIAGRAWQYDVYDSSGNNVTTTAETFPAGVAQRLLVTPVDEYNNPTVPTVTTTIELSDGGGGGTFSLSPGGTPITSFQLYSGQAQQVIYYTPRATGTYHIIAN